MSSKYNSFIKFIKELCDELTTRDVEEFRFLLRGVIPAGTVEKVTNAMTLFELLERENIISENYVDQLEVYFKGIRRMDLIEKLDSYKENVAGVKISGHDVDSRHGLELKLVKLPKEDESILKSIENIDDSDGSPIISPSSHSVYFNSSQTNRPGNDSDQKGFLSLQANRPGNDGDPKGFLSLQANRAGNDGDQKGFRSLSEHVPAASTDRRGSLPSPELRKGRDSTPSPKLLPPNFFKRSVSPKAPDPKDSAVTQTSVVEGKTVQPPSLSSQRSSQYVGPEEYEMLNCPHGDCIIFSNRFEETITLADDNELSLRNGTERDVELLKKTFEFLNFTVTIYRNETAQGIINTLKHYAQQKEQANNDCFLCCVLSHGFEGGFYGNDGGKIESKTVKNIFTGDNCPALVTKPKLFFIQACQGDTDGKYAKLEADGGNSPIAQDHIGDLGDTGDADSMRCQVYKESIAADADILFFMATTPGTTSWRDTVHGSWFVQTLCKVFQKNAHAWSLMDMLLEVNNEIAFKQGRLSENIIAKQMSNLCENTLRKQLRFFPDNFIGTTNPDKVPAES